MGDKDQNGRVKFPHLAQSPYAERNVIQHPPFADPEGHETYYTQRHWNRRSLKVLCLACRVVGHVASGNVEPRKPEQTTECKVGQEEMVERSAYAHGESCGGGTDAERNEVGERIEFLAHERRLLAPARYFAVHEIEEETKRDEC